MEVAVTDLRAHLSHWLERVRGGDEIVVTDRGVPVARILGITAAPAIEQLTRQGVIATPAGPGRTAAAPGTAPRPRRPLADRVAEHRG